ncbi:hypothetical protein FACS189452_02680 [Bacteroidia bacterium]|nr:hypothetical protein FACS189452_02680 [Bacteroidia bacterium]
MSLDAGNSGDEDASQIPQGKYVLAWYKTAGMDTTNLTFSNLKYYGSSLDVVAAFFNDTFHVDNIHTTRHIFNSWFGYLCILFASLMAYVIAGWRAGVFTMLLLFLSPRFLGHSFNNPKDIPFAASIMMAVFFMLQFFRQFPKVKKSTVVFLILSIALSISVRIGGLILFGFFGLFGLVYCVQNYFAKRNTNIKTKKLQHRNISVKHTIPRLLLYGIGICVAGYFLGLVLWPFALQSPIKNPMEAFMEMSKFSTNIRQVFEGQSMWSDQLPWYYTPKYILTTIPIAVIIGAVTYLFAGGLSKGNRFATFIVYFSFIFPVFWIVYSNANVYGGWRHSLFAYPPMVVAAGLGFSTLVDMAKNKYAKIVLTTLPFLLLLNLITFTVKNHPYEYVYFNRFVGGIKGAYGNYEMDYYYHSTREMSEWVKKDVQQNGTPDSTRKIKVVTWHVASVQYFFRHDTADFSVNFSRWYERGFNDWDYGVFAITGMLPELLKNKKAFPPKNTAYQIKVDGVPIGIVLKREDKSDYYGHRAMKEGRIGEAVDYLKQALAYDPYNEQALEDLITIYPQIGMPDSALALAQRWVAFNKGNTTALNQLANLYYSQGKYSNATLVAGSILKYNSRDISGLWISAHAYAEQGQLDNALRNLQKLLTIRGDYTPAYEFMAELFERAGDKRQAQEIRNAINN